MSVTGYLVRRGLAVARDQNQQAADGKNEIQLNKKAMAALLVTILIFSLLMFCIRYTYLAVIGTLAIVESPQTEIHVKVDLLDGGDQTNKHPEPELMVVKPQPITAKLRTAVSHLRAKAGYWSRFRGLSLFIVYAIARNMIVHLVSVTVMGNRPAGRLAAHFFAEVLLARFEMTWVHIVISEPSKLAWYKRIPRGWKPFKNIVPAAALKSAATQIVIGLPMIYACHSKLGYFSKHPQSQISETDAQSVVINAIITAVMYPALVILIEIPATVTFVRVAASMLPEEDESIVPFDRTFGGKVVPAILGGSGRIGIVEAWRSFDRSSRIRLLKLVVKVIAIQTALTILFAGVVIGQLQLTMGDEFNKIVQQAKMVVKH